ncbi:MAG: hypothetical protein IPF57_14580 [Gammaproteobacteria bacterium]|nr:hypothetical protein [Gammaproteobacteria bacterium]
MKLSDLRNFLCGALEARELSRLIQGEVVAFREASLKKGSVMSVILVGRLDWPSLPVTQS